MQKSIYSKYGTASIVALVALIAIYVFSTVKATHIDYSVQASVDTGSIVQLEDITIFDKVEAADAVRIKSASSAVSSTDSGTSTSTRTNYSTQTKVKQQTTSKEQSKVVIEFDSSDNGSTTTVEIHANAASDIEVNGEEFNIDSSSSEKFELETKNETEVRIRE